MTKASKTLSAGIVPVRKNNGSWQFLLLRCFNYWDFPKGEVEQNEDPWKAAYRELEEETGITSAHPRWKEVFYETEVYGKGKIARYYLAEVEGEQVIALRPNPETGIIEHHEFRWIGAEEAKLLLVPRVRKVLDWAVTHLDAT